MYSVDYSHRFGEIILNSSYDIKKEIDDVIKNISINDIEGKYKTMNENRHKSGKTPSKGKQAALNEIFRERFGKYKWEPEKAVFNDTQNDLVMDFWKNEYGIDVAFNHRSFIGGDLLRLQAAAEVVGLIKMGIYICATKDFAKYLSPKDCNSMVSFDRTKWYLDKFYPVLTTPIYLIGLTQG